MANFVEEKAWRIITNLWTIVLLVFIVINFFTADKYNSLIGPLSALYIGMLAIYAGTKEFDRWHKIHTGRHPGEIFVYAWSIIVLGLFIASLFLNNTYKVPSEIIAAYIAVLSIFALTQKSKKYYLKKAKK
ncbi:MAG: hypothetical protein WCX12_00285 [Candidatus Paceibacterota bacterium]|jgi:hypothetical protein